ncbi:MAG TPA: hypothetical protein VFB59_02130 [Candidatus Saccharimonadales bacterium]|nr:hypothetical protein [Candidatus Saccharimonadales bacterium]
MLEAVNSVDFLNNQAFVVDPRGQGFGLAEYDFLDGYANKFYILSGPNGSFVSPRAIPEALSDYYAGLGVATAPRERTLSLPPTKDNNLTLAQRVQQSPTAKCILDQASGDFVVPYMLTDEVQTLARGLGHRMLARPGASRALADKEVFQLLLADISLPIQQETGLEVAIPSLSFVAQDRAAAMHAYLELSQQGRKGLVVVKPKSASALGIFVLGPKQGFAGLEQILDTKFAEDERVLLETFVKHNHSPSMQGFRLPDSPYSHSYMGRQFISMQDGRIEYDASQIPFDTPKGPINNETAARMRALNNALGDLVIAPNGIAGIAGFDSVIQTDNKGNLVDLKLTELNLHLPSTFAVHTAIQKLFPEGFTGIAYNRNVPLLPGETFEDFMRRNAPSLVHGQKQFGMLPLNGSFPDKVDVILFARDKAHLQQLQASIT